MSIITFITSLIGSGALNSIDGFIKAHGYEAIFGLMVLESAALPIPSEIILPFAGLLAARRVLNLYYAFASAFIGSMIGMAIGYYVGYFIGKDLIYKHLNIFRIKREKLDAFDRWFEKNAIPSVFFSRLVPEIRAIMSYPAGFTKMPKREFFLYTGAGVAIWDSVLIAFGYFLLSSKSAIEILASIGIFAIALYAIYVYAMKRMRKT